MKCPCCESKETQVVDSRERVGGFKYRRRECLVCGEKFATYEIPDSFYYRLRKIEKTVETINKVRKYLNEVEI